MSEKKEAITMTKEQKEAWEREKVKAVKVLVKDFVEVTGANIRTDYTDTELRQPKNLEWYQRVVVQGIKRVVDSDFNEANKKIDADAKEIVEVVKRGSQKTSKQVLKERALALMVEKQISNPIIIQLILKDTVEALNEAIELMNDK